MRDAPCFACGCEHVEERLPEDLRDSEEPSGDPVRGIGRAETPMPEQKALAFREWVGGAKGASA